MEQDSPTEPFGFSKILLKILTNKLSTPLRPGSGVDSCTVVCVLNSTGSAVLAIYPSSLRKGVERDFLCPLAPTPPFHQVRVQSSSAPSQQRSREIQSGTLHVVVLVIYSYYTVVHVWLYNYHWNSLVSQLQLSCAHHSNSSMSRVCHHVFILC